MAIKTDQDLDIAFLEGGLFEPKANWPLEEVPNLEVVEGQDPLAEHFAFLVVDAEPEHGQLRKDNLRTLNYSQLWAALLQRSNASKLNSILEFLG